MSRTCPSLSMPSPSPHVLIVEDSPVVMMILENKMKQIGCFYSKASTGEEAIRLIKKNKYNMIVTDIGLPGISGLELSNHIRNWETENNKTLTPIIGLTANVNHNALTHCKSAGMNDVFTKPINIETLHQLCDTYLQSGQDHTILP